MVGLNEDLALMSERRRDLLHAAKMQQLFRDADENRSQFGERLLLLVGDLMISGGEKLRARSNVEYPVEARNW